jgi:hypothetical protein
VGPMHRVLSFVSPLDRARAASASPEFAKLEARRRTLAVAVFQGGRANGVAQSICGYIPELVEGFGA